MLGFETHEQSVSVLRTVWVSNGVIHAMDCIVVCIRSEITEKYGFTK